MKLPFSIAQWLKKPAALWLSFALVVLTACLGLAVLSRHALRLSRQQSESERREDMQQNIRVALWRLDSRLAPYLATLLDSQDRFPSLQGDEDFVLHRFRIEGFRQLGTKASSFSYVPIYPDAGGPPDETANETADETAEQWRSLQETVPVTALVAAIDALNPEPGISRGQALVQNYGTFQDSSDLLSGRELGSRNIAVQQQVAANRPQVADLAEVIGGVSPPDQTIRLIPTWVGTQLVLVRVGPRGAERTLDGAWIDWTALQRSLLADVDDLVPAASLRPVLADDVVDPSRTLAALPAMIVSEPAAVPDAAWSATHTALLLAWLALVGGFLIATAALNRLIALSERRASFVSAVTHELRTPLTTFRLYSDLLARDMVQDPKDRMEYLQTLRREADRLTHLVDNVLRYSRLERTSKRPELESVDLSQWIERITPRLRDRLSTVEMELVVDQRSDGDWMTDPAAVEQVLFNLIDNAAKYAQDATDRRVHLVAEIDDRNVMFTVTDHGPGVPDSLRSTIFKPFAKSAERAAETAAGVGLGLALARQTAVALGGTLTYQRANDGGASFCLQVPRA